MYMYLPVLLVLVLTLPLLSYWTDTTFAQVLTGISKLSHILSIVLSVDLSELLKPALLKVLYTYKNRIIDQLKEKQNSGIQFIADFV